jgi:polysaccharide biosynthesis transport protein
LRAMHAQFPNKSIDALQRDVDFTAGRDGIIQVYVRDRDPKLAAAIANAYLDYFNRFLSEQMRRNSLPKIQALNERIAEVGRQMQEIARRRTELATPTGSALDGEALELVKNRAELSKELDDLHGAIAARSAARARGEPARLPTTSAVDELERQLAQIDLDLGKLRVRTLPGHPDQIALLERRAAAQAALQQELASLNASDAARAKTIAAMLERRERRVKAIPGDRNRLAEIDQQYSDLRAAMTFLKNSLEDVSLASARSPQVGIGTETAQAPSIPVFPNTGLNVIVAVVVSVLAGILYALLLEYVDESARSRALPTA